MTSGRADGSTAGRVYAILLKLYPADFRAEYGDEMIQCFADWRGDAKRGIVGAVAFWAAVIVDLIRSLSRQWASTLSFDGPSYAWAALAGVAVFLLYFVTLAPTTAFWDAGEYMTAAHIMGIPHPPGSPLFVLIGHAWETLLAPFGLEPGVRINLFGASLSAASHGIWFLVVERILVGWKTPHRLIGAAAAVAFSATAFTVWNHSNVVEKNYVIALFTTALVSWLALRWRDGDRKGWLLVLITFVVALSATNHLMGVLVVPALVAFVALIDRNALIRPTILRSMLAAIAIALSVQLFLPIRAAQRPILAEGSPACSSAIQSIISVYTWGGSGCEALSSVLTREQYGKPSIFVDPSVYPQQEIARDAELLISQFVNYFQYFDWQWARSVAGGDPLFGGARPLFTSLFLLLGLYGARMHWQRDRESAVYLGILFLTLSAGLVIYLNFRYGYSIGRARIPSAAMHEVRERDYFFLIGFSVWGLWTGMGLTGLWRRLSNSIASGLRWRGLAAAPVLALVLMPLALNWDWATRAHDYTARDWAYNVLMSVEPYGVLVTNGDNDTFPLWYLQEVEGIRQDVTVLVTPYLRTSWYLEQIRQLTEPCPEGVDPGQMPTRIVCQRTFHPEGLPQPLLAAGWAKAVEPPRDSILPVSDEALEQYTRGFIQLKEPMVLEAGQIRTTIEAGATILPEDMVTAAMLKATIGERPIHFMPGSPIVSSLGLSDHTVRQGVTWRIQNSASPVTDRSLVSFQDTSVPLSGAAIDLAITDTLVWEVYLRRGRILDAESPWVDAATANILGQYVYTHYAAAQAHALSGGDTGIERHVRQAEWWESVAAN